MNAYRLKPLNFPWTPVLYCSASVVALLLGRIIDIPTPARGLQLGTGLLLLLIAVTLDLWATKSLRGARGSHRGAGLLVTSGPYRHSRNPIYLGYTLTIAAIGLICGNPWFLLAALAAAIVTTHIVIRSEEMHLLARFGVDYERYCRMTRRWL